MFKFYSGCEFTTPASFNWLSLCAIIVSVCSIACTGLYLYLGKRVEIVSLKFQKFCIQNLEEILKELDKKFTHGTPPKQKVRKSITNVSTDIQVFLVSLREIYPEVDFEEMITILEKFTDVAYSENRNDNDVKQAYFKMRMQLYSKLYDYALTKELSLKYRLGIARWDTKRKVKKNERQ